MKIRSYTIKKPLPLADLESFASDSTLLKDTFTGMVDELEKLVLIDWSTFEADIKALAPDAAEGDPEGDSTPPTPADPHALEITLKTLGVERSSLPSLPGAESATPTTPATPTDTSTDEIPTDFDEEVEWPK